MRGDHPSWTSSLFLKRCESQSPIRVGFSADLPPNGLKTRSQLPTYKLVSLNIN
ncbi:hypothetical protein SynMVIR181_01208 [Synechococcus sp. MVIR-18-1]|nr:hypothetical protein SynMVIR181_01208 [Synechococcus sp. MVIR-18-1]